MSGPPPTLFKAVLILARMGARRWFNRICGEMPAIFKRSKKGGRKATPRKNRKGGIFALVIVLSMFLGILFMTSRLVSNVSRAFNSKEADSAGIFEVSWSTYLTLKHSEEFRRDALDKSKATDGGLQLEEIQVRNSSDDGETEHKHNNLREFLAYEFEREAKNKYKLKGEDADRQVAYWLKVFEEDGIQRFKEKKQNIPDPFSTENWPAPPYTSQFANSIGLVLFFGALAMFCTSLTAAVAGSGQAAWSSGKVEWSMEWFYSFPIKARTILLAKVLEYGLLNIFSYFIFISLLVSLFWTAGFSLLSIPLALIFALGINLLIASFLVLAETFLRLKVARDYQKTLQTVGALTGMAAFFVLLFLAQTTSPAHWFVDLASLLPNSFFWFPTSIPAQVCLGGSTAWIAAFSMTAIVVGSMVGCIWGSERLVRRGLIAETGPYQGVRKPAPDKRPSSRKIHGIVGNELKLLSREKSRLATCLIVPLFIIGMNVIIYGGAIEKLGEDFRYASVLAFGIGVYMMLMNAYPVLLFEQQAIWLLYTFPKPLYSLLLPKIFLWTGMGLIYPVVILVTAAVVNSQPDLEMISLSALALTGVVIYAFIASGLGILATDVLETTPRRRQRATYVYLYMLLAAIFAEAFYSPSAWSRVGQVVLSALLAIAIWQKVRDRIPFLLDPTQLPPPRIGLSDGLIGVLVFSSIQGAIFTICTVEGHLSAGPRLLISYLTAGLVVTAATLLVFWHNKVPHLLRTVGIRRKDPAVSPIGLLLNGFLWGAAAAVIGVGYLWLIESVEPLRVYKEELLRQSSVQLAVPASWFIVLGIFIAPVFEEYIFRGLLFRGMLRSVPYWVAVVGSAALFALVHPPISVVPVFGLGIATAICYAKTQWLAAPILAHIVYNCIVFSVS